MYKIAGAKYLGDPNKPNINILYKINKTNKKISSGL